jgi:hypothetical protein
MAASNEPMSVVHQHILHSTATSIHVFHASLLLCHANTLLIIEHCNTNAASVHFALGRQKLHAAITNHGSMAPLTNM